MCLQRHQRHLSQSKPALVDRCPAYRMGLCWGGCLGLGGGLPARPCTQRRARPRNAGQRQYPCRSHSSRARRRFSPRGSPRPACVSPARYDRKSPPGLPGSRHIRPRSTSRTRPPRSSRRRGLAQKRHPTTPDRHDTTHRRHRLVCQDPTLPRCRQLDDQSPPDRHLLRCARRTCRR